MKQSCKCILQYRKAGLSRLLSYFIMKGWNLRILLCYCSVTSSHQIVTGLRNDSTQVAQYLQDMFYHAEYVQRIRELGQAPFRSIIQESVI